MMYYTCNITGEVIKLLAEEQLPGLEPATLQPSEELDNNFTNKIHKDSSGHLHIAVEGMAGGTVLLEAWLCQHSTLFPAVGSPHALTLKAVLWETSKGGWWVSWEDRVWMAHILAHSTDTTPAWRVLSRLRETWRVHLPKY
eukprot:4744824-Prorocentrum_lima.AAC.1